MIDGGIDAGVALRAAQLPHAQTATRMNGFDAIVWRAELADGRTVAVRMLRPGVPPGRELAALELAATHGHPAPRLLATATCADRAVIVTTWCAGRTIGELLQSGADPRRLGQVFGRAHAALHRPLDAAGNAVCHLDFQPFNVLVEPAPGGGWTVSGIVDWANARVADPNEDIAWTRVVFDFAPALLPDLTEQIGQFAAAWRTGYDTVRTLPGDEVLAPYLAGAARRQLADWSRRADAGECSPAVLRGAEHVAERWDRP